MRLLPPGVPGELYIGGDGVAAGYRNRPELTAERFVPDPFHAGERLYRTGDLVRRVANGTLQYLARADNQIKLHGHRIEPSEIEALLREQPTVTNAAVIVRDERLIGYVSPTGQNLTALREALRARLPAYMVPGTLVELEALPETPNGKLDRNALPVPTEAPPAPETPRAHTTLEQLLETICAHTALLLGSPSTVEGDQRFAEVGIDSLSAAELLTRLHTVTGTRLRVSAVFEHPTPRALALHMHQLRTGCDQPTTELDLASRTTLEITLANGASVTEATGCLVTGATGFVGAFLVRELAQRGLAVECLVRGDDPIAARARLRAAMEEYELWDDQIAERIRVHAGDLARPRLGLTTSEFELLAGRVDAVYHSGAHVSAVHPYGALEATNVGGTREALRLAALQRPSVFHHISTIEVFAAHSSTMEIVDVHTAPTPPRARHGGYAQTKWVAEKLVDEAHRRGLPTVTYRLPRIVGDSRTGACQTRDLLWHVLKGCIQAHAAPEELHATYDLAPVDHVVRTIADTRASAGRTLHLTNPHRISFATIVGYLRDAGYLLAPMPLEQWAEHLRNDPDNAATPVLDVFLREMTGAGWSRLAFTSSTPDTPRLTRHLFDTYIDYFARTGYLPKPGE
jgi:thioester reductase-like protein